jgi:hypothetical protein
MWFPSTVDKMQNIFGLEIELNDFFFFFFFFLSLAILQKINPSYCMSMLLRTRQNPLNSPQKSGALEKVGPNS